VAACSFRSAQAATLLEFHVPLSNCFVRRWFCVVRGPNLPLHRHNWLSFGKFQDTELFLIPCPRHVSSRLPPSGETCKYNMAPRTQKKLRDSLILICSPSVWPSRLLYRRGRKSRRDLWISLYMNKKYVLLVNTICFYLYSAFASKYSYVACSLRSVP
jgi:hypothetical protein